MYLSVKVTAGAKKEMIKKRTDTRFDVSVREKAEHNQANARVLEIMAEELGVSRKLVRIVNGHQSPSKLLFVDIS